MWHSAIGKIKYDPYRGKMKHKTEWWAVLNVDKEITRYYRWWIQNQYHVTLCQPSWDAHISIIRGEKPSNDLMGLWGAHDGKLVTFKYQHNVQVTSSLCYWFVEIDCPILIDIRKELERPANWKLHLTIGRTYN